MEAPKPSAGDIFRPTVVIFSERVEPYKPASIERLQVTYTTDTTIRVERGSESSLYPNASPRNKPVFSVPMRDAFFLPLEDEKQEQAWSVVTALHQLLTLALGAIACKLQEMGAYAERLEQAGVNAPNPLCAEVVIAEDPADLRWGSQCLGAWHPPAISRLPIARHTPKMLVEPSGTTKTQAGKFVCCQAEQWEELQLLHNFATQKADAIEAFFRAASPPSEPVQRQTESIEATALALPEERRRRLALALLQSLPPDLESAGVDHSKNFTGWMEEQRNGKETYFRYTDGGSVKSKKIKSRAAIALFKCLQFRRHPWQKTLAILSKFPEDAQAALDRLHEGGLLSTDEVGQIMALVGAEKGKVDANDRELDE